MLKNVFFIINILCKCSADVVTTWPGTNVFEPCTLRHFENGPLERGC